MNATKEQTGFGKICMIRPKSVLLNYVLEYAVAEVFT